MTTAIMTVALHDVVTYYPQVQVFLAPPYMRDGSFVIPLTDASWEVTKVTGNKPFGWVWYIDGTEFYRGYFSHEPQQVRPGDTITMTGLRLILNPKGDSIDWEQRYCELVEVTSRRIADEEKSNSKASRNL